jgi:hypothetical protein
MASKILSLSDFRTSPSSSPFRRALRAFWGRTQMRILFIIERPGDEFRGGL